MRLIFGIIALQFILLGGTFVFSRAPGAKPEWEGLTFVVIGIVVLTLALWPKSKPKMGE